MKNLTPATLLFILTTQIFAMEYETVKMIVWRKGESISGQEFIAANETVVDYLAALPRPSEASKYFKYHCQVKGKESRLQVTPNTIGPTQYDWVNTIMIYDIKDCKKID